MLAKWPKRQSIPKLRIFIHEGSQTLRDTEIKEEISGPYGSSWTLKSSVCPRLKYGLILAFYAAGSQSLSQEAFRKEEQNDDRHADDDRPGHEPGFRHLLGI